MKHWTKKASATAIIVLVLFWASPKPIADIIRWTSDAGKTTREENGDIVSETFDEVEVKSGGGNKKFKQKDIVSISYSNQHPQMTEGQKYEDQGNYAKAVDTYRKALGDAKLKSVFKQHIMFRIAWCIQASKKYDEAIAEYDKLLKEIQNTKYLYESYLNKSKCALGKTDTKLALDILEQGKTHIKSVGMEDKFIHELDLVKAKIQLDSKQPSDAQLTYQRVVGGAGKYPYLSERANVGLGQCYISAGKLDDAERAFSQVIEKSKDNLALAGAYNGRGDCYVAKANVKKEKELYKTALRDNYLRAKVMHAPAEDDPTYEYEKSCYFSAYCYEILAQYPPPDKKEVYIAHAKAIYTELINNFKNSSFRPDAEKRLAQLSGK